MPSSDPFLKEEKSALRRSRKELWRGVDPAVAAVESRAVADALADALADWRPALVFAFLPMPDEPEISALWENPVPGVRFAFPKTDRATLSIAWFESCGGPPLPGPHGTREPDPATWLPAPTDTRPDLVLVPGLAFDPATGARLGRGMGYYDRFLSRIDPASTRIVGVACSWHLAEGIPCGAHDVPVRWLATPRGVMRTAAPSC